MGLVYNNLWGSDNALKKLNATFFLIAKKKDLFLHASLFRPPCLYFDSYLLSMSWLHASFQLILIVITKLNIISILPRKNLSFRMV